MGRDSPWNCKYCGNGHKRGREQCPAHGRACRACGIANHFAKVCQASSKSDKIKKVNVLEDAEQREGDSDTEDRLFLATEYISTVNSPGQKWFVHLCLNNEGQACQLDIGSTCNVMSSKIKEKLSPGTVLHPSKTKLNLYSREIMPSLGTFYTECAIRGEKHNLLKPRKSLFSLGPHSNAWAS